jgi:hypothetical protein
MGRKIGVGFNRPRVLGKCGHDHRRSWDLMRRLTRLVRGPDKQFRWQAPIGSNVPETFRKYRQE